MRSVLLSTITHCNIYIYFNHKIFFTLMYFYNVHERYIKSWGMVGAKKGLKLQYKLQSNNKDSSEWQSVNYFVFVWIHKVFLNPIFNFNHICVFKIFILLSVGSQVAVIHLETCGSTQPCVALWTAEFCTSFFVYVRTYMALNAYIE